MEYYIMVNESTTHKYIIDVRFKHNDKVLDCRHANTDKECDEVIQTLSKLYNIECRDIIDL
jgi:hypothetical protein